MHRRIILVLVLLGWLIPSTAAAAGTRTLIVTLKDGKSIDKVLKRYKGKVLGQIGDEPIYLIEVEDKKSVKKKLKKEKNVVGAEDNRTIRVHRGKAGSGDGDNEIDLDQSTMSLFQSVMSLFGDHSYTSFFGTEVLEDYANQGALDLVHVSDIRHLTTGAGTRIAFIDTGVDYDHPALRPWVDAGVDLLGTGSASELGGVDQSVMSLFDDLVRRVKNGTHVNNTGVHQSTMSLFWNEVRRLNLEQSVMSLFWQALKKLDLDQSVMSLFWRELQELDLDQSTMSLFANFLQEMGLDQSTMSLFSDGLREMYLDQSVMSLFGDDAKAWDSFGHGTLVAGLLHAAAPEARLVPIRAFDAQGQSTLFLAMVAVYAAINQGADVINMSFSIGQDSEAFRRVLQKAWSNGIALVASAGNNAEDASNIYPASYPIVIAVAATDLEDRLTDFSNFGKTISVTAPGDRVVTTFPGGLYARASGTSFSAPLVSGSVALLISLGKRSNAAASTIILTADSIDALNPEFIALLGKGRINLLNALGKKH